MRQMHSDDRLGICPDPDPATADRTDHVHYRRNRGQKLPPDRKHLHCRHCQYVIDRNDNGSQYFIQFPILSHIKAFLPERFFFCFSIDDS